MPAPKIASIEFAVPPDPASGECELTVRFEGGGGSTFTAATYDRPAVRLATSKRGAAWSDPVLFVERLDRETVRRAVEAMAADMGGYWLRYYHRRKK